MMRTLLLATLVQVVLVAAAEKKNCDTESSDKCPTESGASLLQMTANPDTASLLVTENDPHAAAAPAGDAATPTTAAPSTTGFAGFNVNTTNATNATVANATSEVSTTPPPATGCVTKEDERAKAWFAETAPVGTPCVFGVDGDVRDEGSHCILDNGDFGTNGWCYTAKDRSSWGSCNGLCPLYGPSKQLGAKIDKVDNMVDKVLQAVVKDVATNASNVTDVATNASKNETPALDTGKGPKPATTPAATDDAKKETPATDNAKKETPAPDTGNGPKPPPASPEKAAAH